MGIKQQINILSLFYYILSLEENEMSLGKPKKSYMFWANFQIYQGPIPQSHLPRCLNFKFVTTLTFFGGPYRKKFWSISVQTNICGLDKKLNFWTLKRPLNCISSFALQVRNGLVEMEPGWQLSVTFRGQINEQRSLRKIAFYLIFIVIPDDLSILSCPITYQYHNQVTSVCLFCIQFSYQTWYTVKHDPVRKQLTVPGKPDSRFDCAW